MVQKKKKLRTFISKVSKKKVIMDDKVQTKDSFQPQNQNNTSDFNKFFSYISSQAGREIRNVNEALSEFNRLNHTIQLKTNQNIDYKEQVKQYKEQLQESNSQLNQAAENLKLLKKRIKKIEDAKIKAFESETGDENIHSYINQIKVNYQEEIDQKDNEIKNLRNQVHAKNQEISSLNAQIQKKENEVSPPNLSNYVRSEYETKLQYLQSVLSKKDQTIAKKDEQIEEIGKEVTEINKSIEDFQQKVDQLKAESARKDDEQKILKEKLQKKKFENTQLKAKLNQQIAENAKLSYQISEFNLLNEKSMSSKQMKNINDEQSIKTENENIIYDKTEVSQNILPNIPNDLIQQSLTDFEALLKNQNEDIGILTDQRNKYAQELNLAMQVIQKFEELYISQNELIKSSQRKLDDYKKEADAKAKESEKEWNDHCDKVLSIISSDLFDQIRELQSQSKGEVYSTTTELLIDHYKTEIEEISKKKDEISNGLLHERYNAILSQLRNCESFLAKLSNGSSNRVQKISDAAIDEIIRFCANLDLSIYQANESSISQEKRKSIFEDDISSIKELTKTLSGLITKENENQSPVPELLTFILSLIHINSMCSEMVYKYKLQNNELTDALQSQSDQNSSSGSNTDSKYSHVSSAQNNSLHNENIEVSFGEKDNRIKELEAQVNELQIQLRNATENSKKAKEQFCRRAEMMVKSIETKLSKQEKITKEDMNEMENEIKNANEYIAELEEKVNTLEKKRSDEKKQYKKAVDQLQSMNNNHAETISDLKKQLSDINQKYEIDTNELQQKNKKLTDAYYRSEEKRKEYKSLVKGAEENQNTLQDLKEKTDELTKKYKDTISQLEKQLEDAQQSLSEANTKNLAFDTVKQNLMLNIASLKVSERSLSLKLKSTENLLNRERSDHNEKMKLISASIKNQLSSQSSENQKYINNAFNMVISIFEDLNEKPEGQNLIEVLGQLQRVIQIQNIGSSNGILRDAIQVRNIYGIKDTDTILGLIRTLNDKIKDFSNQFNDVKDQNMVFKSTNDKEQITSLKIESKEWNQWSLSLYRLISNRQASSPKEVRSALSEFILSSISHDSQANKIDSLRIEKHLLSCYGDLVRKRLPSQKQSSMRPLMIVCLTIQRIMENSRSALSSYSVNTAPRKPLVPIQ